MMDVVFAIIGVVAALVVLCGVIWLAMAPPRAGRRRWLAPPSGAKDDPTRDWPGGTTPDL